MNRPSKKEIKEALAKLKGATHDESGKPLQDAAPLHLSPKQSNRRIGQKKV